jgi:hypothetical protein
MMKRIEQFMDVRIEADAKYFMKANEVSIEGNVIGIESYTGIEYLVIQNGHQYRNSVGFWRSCAS